MNGKISPEFQIDCNHKARVSVNTLTLKWGQWWSNKPFGKLVFQSKQELIEGQLLWKN